MHVNDAWNSWAFFKIIYLVLLRPSGPALMPRRHQMEKVFCEHWRLLKCSRASNEWLKMKDKVRLRVFSGLKFRHFYNKSHFRRRFLWDKKEIESINIYACLCHCVHSRVNMLHTIFPSGLRYLLYLEAGKGEGRLWLSFRSRSKTVPEAHIAINYLVLMGGGGRKSSSFLLFWYKMMQLLWKETTSFLFQVKNRAVKQKTSFTLSCFTDTTFLCLVRLLAHDG